MDGGGSWVREGRKRGEGREAGREGCDRSKENRNKEGEEGRNTKQSNNSKTILSRNQLFHDKEEMNTKEVDFM